MSIFKLLFQVSDRFPMEPDEDEHIGKITEKLQIELTGLLQQMDEKTKLRVTACLEKQSEVQGEMQRSCFESGFLLASELGLEILSRLRRCDHADAENRLREGIDNRSKSEPAD